MVEVRPPPIISQWRMLDNWNVVDDREAGLDNFDASWEDVDSPAVNDDNVPQTATGKRKRSKVSVCISQYLQ